MKIDDDLGKNWNQAKLSRLFESQNPLAPSSKQLCYVSSWKRERVIKSVSVSRIRHVTHVNDTKKPPFRCRIAQQLIFDYGLGVGFWILVSFGGLVKSPAKCFIFSLKEKVRQNVSGFHPDAPQGTHTNSKVHRPDCLAAVRIARSKNCPQNC